MPGHREALFLYEDRGCCMFRRDSLKAASVAFHLSKSLFQDYLGPFCLRSKVLAVGQTEGTMKESRRLSVSVR